MYVYTSSSRMDRYPSLIWHYGQSTASVTADLPQICINAFKATFIHIIFDFQNNRRKVLMVLGSNPAPQFCSSNFDFIDRKGRHYEIRKQWQIYDTPHCTLLKSYKRYKGNFFSSCDFSGKIPVFSKQVLKP